MPKPPKKPWQPPSAPAKPVSQKPTREEMRARVLIAATMLAEGWTKGRMKAYFRKEFGASYRATERYIRLAREMMAKQLLQLTREDLVVESYHTYQAIINNPKSAPRDKVAARKAIDELLGLAAPKKIAPTTPNGEQPYELKVNAIREAAKELTDEELRILANFRNKIKVIDVPSEGAA